MSKENKIDVMKKKNNDAVVSHQTVKEYSLVQYPDENRTYGRVMQQLQQECEIDINTLQPRYQREDGSMLYRPLTFKEIIQADVDNFNREYDLAGKKRSTDERIMPFIESFTSCTAIAYKAATSRIKVVTLCRGLVEIEEGFKDGQLSIDYNLLDGQEIDRYKEGFDSMEVWRALLEDDAYLLSEYTKIIPPIATMLCKDKDKSKFNRNAWKEVELHDILKEDCLAPVIKCSASSREGIKNSFSCVQMLKVSCAKK